MSQPTADSSSPFGCSPAWLLALNGSGLAHRKPLSLCSQSAFQNATHLAATLRRIQAHKHHLRFCCSFCKKNPLTPTAYREFFLGQNQLRIIYFKLIITVKNIFFKLVKRNHTESMFHILCGYFMFKKLFLKFFGTGSCN